MSTIISFPLPSGPNYTIPAVGDINWGQAVTDFLVAIPHGVMPISGTFALTGDVSFGTSFGLVLKYLKSGSANISSTGFIQMAKTDTIAWRNNANNADLPLGIDGSDNLTFNGLTFGTGGAVNPGTANQLAYYPASTNAVSGLTLITGNRALVSNASGLPIASSVTNTEVGYVSGVTSAIQAQINAVVATANAALPESGGTMSGNITMGGHSITGLANGVNPQDAATVAQLPATVGFTSGDMKAAAYSSVPSGWLLCDGTSYLRASFPALFSAIGTTYGAADGSHFNVPNMVNAVAIGAGSIAAMGITAGAQTHSISSSELPTHNHTINISDPGHAHSLTGFNAGGAQGYPFVNNANSSAGMNSFPNAIGGNTTGITATSTNTGSSTAMSLVQPSLGVTWFIKI